MVTALTIDRKTGNGRYADVLDAAEALGRAQYGSAVNAIAVMVRESPSFARAVAEANAATGRTKRKTK